MLKYKLTQFGNVLLEHIASEMGMLSPDLQESLNKFFKGTDDSTT